ncbi:hypothetical protein HK104_002398, partial [Borealophlyctis nickersoniae]
MDVDTLSSLPVKKLQSYIKAYKLQSGVVVEKSELVELVLRTVLQEQNEVAFRESAPVPPTAAELEAKERAEKAQKEAAEAARRREQEHARAASLQAEREQRQWDHNTGHARFYSDPPHTAPGRASFDPGMHRANGAYPGNYGHAQQHAQAHAHAQAQHAQQHAQATNGYYPSNPVENFLDNLFTNVFPGAGNQPGRHSTDGY